MYVVFYTQKNEKPYIWRLNLFVPLLVALILAGLAMLLVYSAYKAHSLNKELVAMNASNNQALEKLSRAEREISVLEKQTLRLREHPPTAEFLLEALNKAHPPQDTVRPVYSPEEFPLSSVSFYAVQLSAHRSREEAERVVEGLRSSLDHSLNVEEVYLSSGRWFRVLISSFTTFAEAEQYAENLKKRGIIKEYYIQSIPPHRAPVDTKAEKSPPG